MNKEIMKEMGFDKELEKIKQGLCPFCSEKVDPEGFRDEASKKEYSISKLCQSCQDKMFGK